MGHTCSTRQQVEKYPQKVGGIQTWTAKCSGSGTEWMNFKVQKKELSSLQGIYCVTFLQLALNLTVTICCVVYWRILTFPTEPLFDKIITGTIVSAATFFFFLLDCRCILFYGKE